MATTLLTSGITMGSSTMSVSGTAPSYPVRAWVNFNASSGSPSIRGSANISSITDNGTGDFTINLSTAMSDSNFVAIPTISYDPSGESAVQMVRGSDAVAIPTSTSTIRCCTGTSGGSTAQDEFNNSVIVIGHN